MSKDKQTEEEEREQKILDQLAMHGRLPTPPPGKFHKVNKKDKRRDRKLNKQDLRQLVDECNN